MNNSPLDTFIALIDFDRSLRLVETALANSLKKNQHIKEQEQVLVDTLEQAKKVAHTAQKEVDTLELDIKTLDQQEATKKNRLENVTSHKEYQSVKAEIDVLKAKQHELEKRLLESWNVLEAATKALEAKKASLQSSMDALHAQEKQLLEEQNSLQERINAQRQQRPELEKEVPAEWLEKYGAMRSRVEDPVVPVVNNCCSACFYKVSDPDLVLLRRNKLLQCKDCYRFLYLEKK